MEKERRLNWDKEKAQNSISSLNNALTVANKNKEETIHKLTDSRATKDTTIQTLGALKIELGNKKVLREGKEQEIKCANMKKEKIQQEIGKLEEEIKVKERKSEQLKDLCEHKMQDRENKAKEVKNIADQKNALDTQLSELVNAIENKEKELSENEKKIENLSQQIEKKKTESHSLEDKIQSRIDILNEKEKTIGKLDKAIKNVNKGMTFLYNRKEIVEKEPDVDFSLREKQRNYQ